MIFKTEDVVRDEAKEIIGLGKSSQDGVFQGTGQVTTFKQLGFECDKNNKKPDGWYFPKYKTDVAIVLEAKNSKENLNNFIDDIKDYIDIVSTKYKRTVGILYNGYEQKVFLKSNKKNDIIELNIELERLQNKDYYIELFETNKINKSQIYALTRSINDSLHFNFGVKNLYHRMIFTACALVAERYDAKLDDVKDRGYGFFHGAIRSTLAKSFEDAITQNRKVELLLEVYDEIKMNVIEDQTVINDFIDSIVEISDNINSNFWNGEDVMSIFFNEFNRYKKKSESGQVFTPDHITSFMYRLIDVDKNDRVLDAACGSGAFLVKAMCNMMQETGGVNTNQAKEIKQHQLFGIEFDREIFALACANMLIHKDGKTNIEHLDARSATAASWIESKGITKVLMNPPFENKHGCIDIVSNVLDSVQKDVICAFILPDKKLEKVKKAKKILEKHRLLKIIKLPENIFNEGVTTSIFVFKAKVPQKGAQIFSCFISDDGLHTIKNQGRHDIKDTWAEKEDDWIDVIIKQAGDSTIRWLDPKQNLSYQFDEEPLFLCKDDFVATVTDRVVYENKLDIKELSEAISKKVIYTSEIKETTNSILIKVNHEIR